MHRRCTTALALIVLASLAAVGVAAVGVAAEPAKPAKPTDGFTPLFDGETLTGWHALPGGTWKVVDGELVGTSPKTERRHGLLLTDKAYSDFVIRLKFRIVKGNSGFYFRSTPVDNAVGVNGFQAEVENSPKVGGLYETGKRRWVTRPDPKLIKKVYKPGEWNEMSVTAVGRHVVVRVNGAITAELTNDPGAVNGHFALQLHGGMDMDVRFKDIELRKPNAQDVATAYPDGFRPLFNGKNLAGWKTTGNWLVEADGVIALHPRPGEGGWQRYGAYLTTERTYRDFILDLEFKIERRGNSGVFLRVADPASQVNTGFEVQILDTHGKAKPNAHDCGGIIGAAAPARNMAKPAGQWNRYTITCVGSSLNVVLNGEQIIDLDLSKTGLKNRPAAGHIGFQDEAKPVRYRNVRIKELTARKKPTTKPALRART